MGAAHSSVSVEAQLGLVSLQPPGAGPGLGLLPGVSGGGGGGGALLPRAGGDAPPRGPPIVPSLHRHGFPPNVHLDNTSFNDLFRVYMDMAGVCCKSIKDKIRSGALPVLPFSKVEPTKPVCLPWHARAECNTNCSCFYDHVTTYTAAELQPLQLWCTEHFHE